MKLIVGSNILPTSSYVKKNQLEHGLNKNWSACDFTWENEIYGRIMANSGL
jgi:hypothetical protein